MFSYCDEKWVLRHGGSRFEVYLSGRERKPADVSWSLQLSYVAGGARWRRVREHERPEVELSVGSWKLPSGRWTDLEGIKHWGDQEEDLQAGLPSFWARHGGWLELCERIEPGRKHVFRDSEEVQWQVRERDGARFLVELAAGICGEPPAHEEERVLADGGLEAPERDPADFWKEHASIYAVEWVSFGKVTVRVPRNAKDLVGYARRRARELLGLSTPPEAYQIHDFLNLKRPSGDEPPAGAHDDVYVKLHFHGYYEDP